jgi:hypothetical protein
VSKQAILERERRYRLPVVICAIAPLLALIGAIALQSSVTGGSRLAPAQLAAVDGNGALYLLGAIVATLAFVILGAPLLYLFKAAQARTEGMYGALTFLVVLGPVLFGIQGVLFAVGEINVAEEFVAERSGVGDVYSLADNLRDDSTLRTAAIGMQSLAGLAFVFGMIYTPLWAVRTGLLTRFHGTMGMALGASLILPFLAGLAAPLLLAWFMYFGLMLAGRTPRGRPPAWDAGEAVSPLAPGDEPGPAAKSDVIEGDASEIPGVGENPNAARRERAKKRKRKRRR